VGLGLSGLVAASLVASGLELGWVASLERPQVAIVFIAFAFPLQGGASALAFLARDTAVGTALGVLAATWLATGLEYLISAPGSTSPTVGLLLLAAGFLLAASAAGAAVSKRMPAAVFAAEALRFVLIGIHELGAGKFWQDAGGVVGLLVVVLAGYTMLAAVLEAARGATTLPLGRHGSTPTTEPGVRPQL
jgi:hypothetical protein